MRGAPRGGENDVQGESAVLLGQAGGDSLAQSQELARLSRVTQARGTISELGFARGLASAHIIAQNRTNVLFFKV